jgi:murein DD-endopeptidase MepM/ murein hydrolase activator NlpD
VNEPNCHSGDVQKRRARAQAVKRGARRLSSETPVALSVAPPQRSAAARIGWKREHVLLASLLVATTSLVAAIAPGFANASRQTAAPLVMTQPLVLPLTPTESDDPLGALEPDVIASEESIVAGATEWKRVAIRSGQTLGDVFSSLGLSAATLHRLLEHPGAREPLSRIRPGSEFEFAIAPDGHLESIRFDRDEASKVTLSLLAGKIEEHVQQRDLQQRIQMASGEIETSLYVAGNKSGLSNGAIIELAKVFGYDIDFAQDLQVGDRFSVVYEEIYRDGERLRAGDILAATFINQGKRYSAFRYVFDDGRVEYFDADGRPMKKSFLRIPIEFARISSLFSAARKHPILGRTRAHKGVDYAAGNGTPIMAAGDGRISFAGWQNGYGRTVIVDHGRGYSTLYGHMSRFGKAKTGARVRQGETIGFVGMSGLASGPHLHYEFRIGGVHRDPLKVTLPKPEPLPRTELARFRLQTQPMLAKLELLEGGRAYASR